MAPIQPHQPVIGPPTDPRFRTAKVGQPGRPTDPTAAPTVPQLKQPPRHPHLPFQHLHHPIITVQFLSLTRILTTLHIMLKGPISGIWPSQKGLPCSNGSKSILTWTPVRPLISPVILSADSSPSWLTPPVPAIVAGNMQRPRLRILGATSKELCIRLCMKQKNG